MIFAWTSCQVNILLGGTCYVKQLSNKINDAFHHNILEGSTSVSLSTCNSTGMTGRPLGYNDLASVALMHVIWA